MPPIILNAHELADRLDVTYATVLTWVRRDKIPYIRDGSGRVHFNLATVLNSLRQNQTQASCQAVAR